MKQLPLPMPALEIMQACLKHFKDNSEIQKVSVEANGYLGKIEKIINGEVVQLSSLDFWNIHSFVITIFSGLLNDKGKVVNSKWTDNHWNNVLGQIEKCYDKDEIYEVSKMVK